MNDIYKTLLTVGITTAINILAFYISRYYYDPVKKYNELKARTNYYIIYYANKYNNPIDFKNSNEKIVENYREASDKIRGLAADWGTFIYYRKKVNFFILNDKSINLISGNLIGISNSLFLPYGTEGENHDEQLRDIENKINDIRKTLKLKS